MLVQDSDVNVGFFTNIAIGAGYALINDESLTVALTGMLGADIASYSDNGTENGRDYELTQGVVMFSVGADVYLSYRLKSNFGIFANVGVRWLPFGRLFGNKEYSWKVGNTKHTETYEFNDKDANGFIRISPTLGIVWNF